MKRLGWPFLILLICLPVAVLALGVDIPGLSPGPARARPQPVPDGDHELAYLHTTTNANTWERVVSGIARLPDAVPGLTVDDRNAFLDSTTAVPELVLTRDGFPGRLRIRWYKLSKEATTTDWVEALAARRPAPLAIIGGGSTDRALQLARAMNKQTTWRGPRPALFVTTATAVDTPPDEPPPQKLVDIYDDRTFRVCFTNRQMAEAVLAFIRTTAPDLTPADFAHLGLLAACPPAAAGPTPRPNVLSVIWQDDPYSVDLHSRFGEELGGLFPPRPDGTLGYEYQQFAVGYSVGGLLQPNPSEAKRAADVARALRESPTQRAALVLPTGAAQARRFLRAVLEACPEAAGRLVVVTGDGIPVNAILRDGEFAWPVAALPVPLVLFTHNDPSAWDATPHPSGYTRARPTGTEEATHFQEMGRVIAAACYPDGGTTVRDADDLIARLHRLPFRFFDTNGERLDRTGEYVVVVRPRDPTGSAAELSVWKRTAAGAWERVRTEPVAAREGKP